MKINQPATSLKLTNVSIVRLKKGSKRFEIACYKNKIQEYRLGYEKDLGNVLQIEQVFTNVSKGSIASEKELQVFGMSRKEIIQHILMNGQEQLNEQERSALRSQLQNEILEIVVQKTLNPETNVPYTKAILEKTIQWNINTEKNSKQQALEIINNLCNSQVIPIIRKPIGIVVKGSVPENVLAMMEIESKSSDSVRGLICPSKVKDLKALGLELEFV